MFQSAHPLNPSFLPPVHPTITYSPSTPTKAPSIRPSTPTLTPSIIPTVSPTGYTTGAWSALATDSSGQSIIAGIFGGFFYYSSNYGATFASTNTFLSSKNWQSAACSSSGAIAFAVVYSGSIYHTADYGATWALSYSLSLNWYDVDADSSGYYAFACATGMTKYYWAINGAWRAVSLQSQYAFSSTNNYGLACSSNGEIVSFADWANDYVYTYRFTTSTATATILYTPSVMLCYLVSMDSNGTYIVANSRGFSGVYGSIYYSSDGGATFSASSISGNPSISWGGIASSATGMYVVSGATTTGYGIYYSSDYGASFAPSYTTSTVSYSWTAISSDSSGQFYVAASSNYALEYSGSYGQNWTTSFVSPVPSYSPTFIPSYCQQYHLVLLYCQLWLHLLLQPYHRHSRHHVLRDRVSRLVIQLSNPQSCLHQHLR